MMILVAILSSFLTFAQDCSELNLITQENSPFSRMPVLDQSGNGQCYAYVAAQLANYQQIKSGQADRPVVHPAWAAMLYGDTTDERDLRAGVTSHTLQALTNGNNCDEQAVYQTIKARSELIGVASVSEAKIMKFIDDYGKIVRDSQYNLSLESEREHALRRAADQNRYCDLPHWRRLLGMPELLGQDSVDVMRRLLANSCSGENQTKLNLPPFQQLAQGEDSAYVARIDSVLERGNPVGMTFCSYAADNPHSTPPQFLEPGDPSRKQTATNDACGAHIALIAGRKMVGGKCNYLYRNSRGTGWYRDVQHLTCLCRNKATGAFVDNCRYQTHPARTYSVEACWVPKENLVPNIFNLVHY